MLTEIVDILLEIKGNDSLFLAEPVTVRLSPHKWPFEVHGLCVSPKKELYVMDSSGQWEQLSETDPGAELLINSIYQRMRSIVGNSIKASL